MSTTNELKLSANTEEAQTLQELYAQKKAAESLQRIIYKGQLSPAAVDELRQKCQWEKAKSWTLAQQRPHLWSAIEVACLAELTRIDPRKLVIECSIGYYSVTQQAMDYWTLLEDENRKKWAATFKEA
jgi:hypothetical protein